ncbi:MAG: MerR family transcriptional regulator [Trueperaceae bacterium]
MSPTAVRDEVSGNGASTIGVLKIGQVARQAGLGVETVRFYERQGLLEEPPRTDAGYRQYPTETVSRLRFIQRAKALGFSLAEIKELISLRLDFPADADADADAGEVRSRAQGKIDEIEAKIGDLRRMKSALVKLVSACDGASSTDYCPILTALEGDIP